MKLKTREHGNTRTHDYEYDKKESEMLKIEDLKVGDELECIDRDGFLNERRNAEYLLHNKMIVSDMNEHEIYLRCDSDEKSCRNYIYIHELKYFKKKEPVKEYDFNDLIDVAVQAVKDGLIKNLDIRYSYIEFEDGKERYNYAAVVAGAGIRVIKSLYKEKFTIESEDDILRIKENALLTLTNGVKCNFLTSGGLWKITEDYKYFHSCSLLVLKGATVEQSR